MRLVKVYGVVLATVFTFSAMATTRVSAHTFNTSFLLLPLLEQEGPQLFIFLAGHLLCTTLDGHEHTTVSQSLSLTLKLTVKYTGCTMTARGITAKPDEPIATLYEMSADGTVTLLSTIVILASLEGSNCTILVPAQGPLSTVKYREVVREKSLPAILMLASIKNVLTSAAGAGCQETFKNSATGSFDVNGFFGHLWWV
jgi:hypothetical protein